MVVTTLNHYRIEYALGRGGMGEVYAAEDTRLHRHPNIVTIRSVEHAGDLLFLTMELVEGKTLADLVPPTDFN